LCRAVSCRRIASIADGGADGTTGTHSLYTVEFGKEVMFHVSTMLPYSKGNPQQVSVCVYVCVLG
jgi:hypothetical protein